MKTLLLVAFVSFFLAACTSASDDASTDAADEPVTATGDFDAPLGVQLWSFREQAEEDPIAMLGMVRDMGFTHVETAGMYDMPADSFLQAIQDADLRVTSMHVSYEQLRDDPETVIANAQALGVTYVGIAWYPHENGNFTEATARQAIADFNAFGQTLSDAGLRFFYHNHGYEPSPHGDGTLLDLIIDETDPELVWFEMDVLWTWQPGLDPVALIQRHPGRFKLMHIKDMKPGIERGSLSGGLPAEQKSIIGQGQVDWPTLLAAAEADGFEHYYVEDESTDPVAHAPQSVAYLQSLTYDE